MTVIKVLYMNVHVIVKEDEFKITVNLILISWMKTVGDVCQFALYKKTKKRKETEARFSPSLRGRRRKGKGGAPIPPSPFNGYHAGYFSPK